MNQLYFMHMRIINDTLIFQKKCQPTGQNQNKRKTNKEQKKKKKKKSQYKEHVWYHSKVPKVHKKKPVHNKYLINL